METLRIIKHDETHTDIEALIYGEWVVVKCILEDTMSPKSPVTVQEMDRVAKSIGLKMYNGQAMKKVCLMVRLGFEATLEMYQREERNTNEAEQRKQAAEAAEIDNWLGNLTPAQTEFVSWVTDSVSMFETFPAMVDPRTDEQIALDIFQSETEATRNTDYPV